MDLRPMSRLTRPALAALATGLLVACHIAPPRTDDPNEHFNREMYAFNDHVDKTLIRPVAVGYRTVTTPGIRTAVSDFYTNIRLPVTVANDLLQGRPKGALLSTSRFVVNLTIGFLGFKDPASLLGLPQEDNDFGVTLARWGLPEGDYLVLPFVGSTTVRDVWRLPVDSYFFDPLSYYSRNNHYAYGQEYVPSALYLVTLRARHRCRKLPCLSVRPVCLHARRLSPGTPVPDLQRKSALRSHRQVSGYRRRSGL
jgi:phospholipid-binding lipoprotein MlaA